MSWNNKEQIDHITSHTTKQCSIKINNIHYQQYLLSQHFRGVTTIPCNFEKMDKQHT